MTNQYTDPNSDIIKSIVAKYPNGFSAQGLATTVMIESSGNPSAVSPGGGFVGLGQVGLSEYEEYGPKGGTRLNPEDNLECVANLAQCNARVLQHALMRKPTDSEIYLAHQQGATGALKLIENPRARAGDLVGDSHIDDNDGDSDQPASVFTQYWANRFLHEEDVNG
jgi:hypothetical protein